MTSSSTSNERPNSPRRKRARDPRQDEHRAPCRPRARQRPRRLRRFARRARRFRTRRFRNMPSSKVVGHAGNLCFGEVGDVPVVCMQGRVHFYEGHDLDAVVHGVRDDGAPRRHGRAPHERRRRLRAELRRGRSHDRHRSPEPHHALSAHRPERRRARPALSGHERARTTQSFATISRAAAKELGIALREGVYAWLTGPVVRDARGDPHAPNARRAAPSA